MERSPLNLADALQQLLTADEALAIAINFSEPTENSDQLGLAESRARHARNQAVRALSAAPDQAELLRLAEVGRKLEEKTRVMMQLRLARLARQLGDETPTTAVSSQVPAGQA